MRVVDETGNRYGNLVVIGRHIDKKRPYSIWACLCDCGEVVNVSRIELHDKRKGRGRRYCGKYCIYRKQTQEKDMRLVGERFGSLVVLSRGEDRLCVLSNGEKAVRKVWMCECDCGVQREFNQSDILRILSKNIMGCGYKCPYRIVARQEKRISGLDGVYNEYKKNANKRGYTWHLSKDDFLEITQKACFYCGSSPSKQKREFVYNGIDRVDNEVGYVENNCVPCCWSCNRMKGELGFQLFKDAVSSIYNFLSTR